MTQTNSKPYFLLVLFTLLSLCYPKLLILSPPQLKKLLEQKYPSGIHYSVANYGDVPFGKSLTGTVYTSSFLQNCRYEALDAEAQKNPKRIVISERGDCSFTTKSINSQKQGAMLAVLVDNNLTEDPGQIIMVDDGRGPQVRIPTILVNHQVGQTIVQFVLKKKQPVSLVVNFQTHKKPVADVTLWMNSFDRRSYVLIRQLQPYLTRLKDSIKLSVYHPTTVCYQCRQTDCYNQNKYCIDTGFQGYFVQEYGRELIKQQLREEIVAREYPQLWWKYVQGFDQQCAQRDTIQYCSNSILANLGISVNEINNMVQTSFTQRQYLDPATNTTKYTMDNKILQKNAQLKKNSGIIVFPAVIVNNITYRGNLDGLDIFQLICQSLETQPAGCDLQPKVHQTSVIKYVIIMAVLFVVIMGFLVFCYRRQARRDISKNLNNEVNQLVNQYITMYEAQRFQTTDGGHTGSTTQATPTNK